MQGLDPIDRRAIEGSLIKTALDSVIVIDKAGVIVEFSEAAERTLGWKRESAVGKPLVELVIPPELRDAHRAGMQRYQRTRRSKLLGRRIEVPALRADARRIWVELAVNEVRSGEKTFFVAFLRDISERKEGDEALERALQEARESSQAKTRFLGSMSHELRTPLTAIMGYSDLLKRYPQRDEAERIAWSEHVLRNADHLLALLNDLLDLSKLEQSEVVLTPIDLNLLDVILDVVGLMGPLAEREGLDFAWTCEPLLPRVVRADPVRLKQILINLLSNAIKYTPEGSIRLEVCTAQADAQTEVVLSVHDSGIGIPADSLDKVFGRFEQLHGRDAGREGGVGLGLDIAQRLAQLQGGHLSVASEVGVGSVFSLSLPCSAADLVSLEELRHAGAKRRQLPRRHTFDSLRVLVADDYASVRELICLLLEDVGAEVVAVENGALALEALAAARSRGEPFDVACFDMSMPVLDGAEAVRRLRAEGDDIPVIALTARAMKGDRAACLEAGCTSYLSKPIVNEALHQAIAEAVGQVGGTRAMRVISSGSKAPAPAREQVFVDARFLGLAKSFQEELSLAEQTVRDAQSERDADSLQHQVHRLAGTAGSYGFAEVGRQARTVETALRTGLGVAEIPIPVGALIQAIQEARRAELVGRGGG